MATGTTKRNVRRLGQTANKTASSYDRRTTLERSQPCNLAPSRDSRREIRQKMLNLVSAAVAFISEANRCD